MPVPNALGKYGHAVTAGVVALVLLAWVGVQVAGAFGLVVGSTGQLDALALAAFTYLLGNVSALNGLKPAIDAANKRLDAVGAPPAEQAAQIVGPNGGTPSSSPGGAG